MTKIKSEFSITVADDTDIIQRLARLKEVLQDLEENTKHFTELGLGVGIDNIDGEMVVTLYDLEDKPT